MTSDERLELLESCVALRREGERSRESIRRALATIESSLATLIGPLVRKRVAARLLGVSVQALDRWIAAGRIPTEPIAPASRTRAIPTEFVIDLAVEQARGSDEYLASALDRLQEQRYLDAEIRDAHHLIEAVHELAAGVHRARIAG